MKLQRLLALLILIICQTISQVSLFVISKRVTKVGVVAVYPRHVYESRFQVLLCSLHEIWLHQDKQNDRYHSSNASLVQAG